MLRAWPSHCSARIWCGGGGKGSILLGIWKMDVWKPQSKDNVSLRAEHPYSCYSFYKYELKVPHQKFASNLLADYRLT